MTATPLALAFEECRLALVAGDAASALQRLTELEKLARTESAKALVARMTDRARALLRQGKAVETTLLELDRDTPLAGTSIVGASMNREGNLLKALPSWLASGVDEIVIVDWSSDCSVWELVKSFRDPRVHVIRIDDEPRWILSHAFNAGLRFARHSRIYKLDADIQIEPNFFSANAFAEGEFIRGFWKMALDAGEDEQVYINGSFGAWKSDLRHIGYYDERILTYGWDDSDLYSRLNAGLARSARLLSIGSLHHLDQQAEQRIANQDILRRYRFGKFSPTDYENQVNRFYVASLPEWTCHHAPQDYLLRQIEPNYWVGRRTTARANYIKEQRLLAETLAARCIASWIGQVLPQSTWPLSESLEWARLLRLADAAGKSVRFMEAIRSGRGIQVVATPSTAWREAAVDTIEALASNEDRIAENLIIVADDGFCPDSEPDFRVATGVRASHRLATVIAEVVKASPIGDPFELERMLTGEGVEPAEWRFDADSLANAAIQRADRTASALGSQYLEPAVPLTEVLLITSVYDEKNLLRLCEYLTAIALNLRVFDRIVLVYESRSGMFMECVGALLARLQLRPERVQFVSYADRPTIGALFGIGARLAGDALVAVGNADVAFDGTLTGLVGRMTANHFVVLGRRELRDGGARAELIRTPSGAPNIYSADAWIARVPLLDGVDLEYPIGSFYCDSFINGQLGRLGQYKALNPCLDVNLFHFHDLRFNSSETKQSAQRFELEDRYIAEGRRWGDPSPIKGLPWCSLSQLEAEDIVFPIVQWRPRVICIDQSKVGPTLGGLILAAVFAGGLATDLDAVVLLRGPRAAVTGRYGALIARLRQHLGLSTLIVDVDEVSEHHSGAGSRLQAAEVRAILNRGGVKELNQSIRQIFDGTGEVPPQRVDFLNVQCTFDTEATLDLIAVWQRDLAERVNLLDFAQSLANWLPEKRLLEPFLPELGAVQAHVSDKRTAAIGRKRPQVAFVTSMFRGGAHTWGYLENVVAAASRADGEVVIVDANPDDSDGAVVREFLRQNAYAAARVTYLHPERDPGLYACWQLAIEHSDAEFITNANLDDRRSPLHTARLVALLESRPTLAAACGALTVVGVDQTGGWFDIADNEVWFADGEVREFGYEDLFRRNSDGLVYSQNMLHCMPVWRRALHQRHGFFDEEKYGTSADWAFWLQCARAGERYVVDPRSFGRYLFNPISHNRRNDSDGAKERRIIGDLIGVDQEDVIKQ
jgi:glycosyltransferase involved in cell wall biosynthesis